MKTDTSQPKSLNLNTYVKMKTEITSLQFHNVVAVSKIVTSM